MILIFPACLPASVGLYCFRVGIEVVEGLWLGEQRGRQNSLKLLLDEGQHSLRVRLESEGANMRALRDSILHDAQV